MIERRPVLTRLHELARPTDGVVATRTLVASGFSEDRMRSLRRRGAMTPVAYGVHLVGDVVLNRRQAIRSGLLAAGDGSIVCGRTAAELYGLLPQAASAIDIGVSAKRRRRTMHTKVAVETNGFAAAIDLRPRRLAARSRVIAAFPVASPSDVLFQLADAEGGDALHRAWREADFLGLLDVDELAEGCRQRQPGHRLVAELTGDLPAVRSADTELRTRSEFALLEALLRLGVPRPHANAPMLLDDHWYFPDLWWKAWQAVIEVDGPIHTRANRAAEDAARDAHMRQHGIGVLRVERDAVLANPVAAATRAAKWLYAHCGANELQPHL